MTPVNCSIGDFGVSVLLARLKQLLKLLRAQHFSAERSVRLREPVT